MHRSDIQRWTFLLFIALVSVAFAWIVSPFFGAVFWGVVLAIVLNPAKTSQKEGLSQAPTVATTATTKACARSDAKHRPTCAWRSFMSARHAAG